MIPRWVAALAIAFCMLPCAAHAQSGIVERQVAASPGHDVRVGIYTAIRPDCTAGPLPAIKLVIPPAHGTVSVKRGMLKATNVKQCLAIDAPAFVAFYRAAADFSGADIFELEISGQDGGKRRERIRVIVAASPPAGDRI